VGRPARAAAALLGSLLTLGCATSRDEPPVALFVGTSGDYAPFSLREQPGDGAGGGFAGFDPAVARAYAADRGWEVRFVPFEWPNLLSDLESGRFEVAMSGVTVRPERSIAGRFSQPVARSGAVVLTRVRPGERAPRSLAQVDFRGARIGVNAGGHLERVARQHLMRATIVPVPDNAAVLARLLAGDFDTVVTDTQEAPHWKRADSHLVQIGPFTRDRKAYLVRSDLPELSRDLDAWLLENESNGRLGVLRAEHLASQEREPEVGWQLNALLAAIDERLALMPWVAEAKRGAGTPIEAPDREQEVVDAAVAATLEAAKELELAPPNPRALERLFVAQIEAAKQIQRDTLAKPPQPEVGNADLKTQLRPALIRIGDRIARLTVRKPALLRNEAIIRATMEALSTRGLDNEHTAAIAAALIRLDHDQ
jgi:cyclohexadienyl dehydratase